MRAAREAPMPASTLEDLLVRLEKTIHDQEEHNEQWRRDQEQTNQTIRDKQNALDASILVIQRDMSNVAQNIGEIDKKLDEKSHLNWQAILVIVSIMIFVLPGLGFYMNTVVAPVSATTALNSEAIRNLTTNVQMLQQSAAGSTAADVNSRTDREQLNTRMQASERTLADEITSRREQEASFNVHLIEGETQIQAIYNLMNSEKSANHKMFSIVWSKVFPGTQFPDDNYYPHSTIAPNTMTAPGDGK